MKLKDYFNIPNCLSYFRIIMLPVFMFLYLNAETTTDFIIAFVALALSLLSDMFDGIIARRFNMITEFGKFIDPLADKLTIITLVSIVAIKHPVIRIVLVIAIIKELYMGIIGLYLLKLGNGIIAAKLYGKVATAVTNVGIFLLLMLPNIDYLYVNIIAIIICFVDINALVHYIVLHTKVIKEIKAKN